MRKLKCFRKKVEIKQEQSFLKYEQLNIIKTKLFLSSLYQEYIRAEENDIQITNPFSFWARKITVLRYVWRMNVEQTSNYTAYFINPGCHKKKEEEIREYDNLEKTKAEDQRSVM